MTSVTNLDNTLVNNLVNNPVANLHEAMLQSLEGGQFHVRERLTPEQGLPYLAYLSYADYVAIGMTLRRCFEQPALHEALIQKLRPHAEVIIGVLPPGMQPHGLLPTEEEALQQGITPRPLEDITEAQMRQWIMDDGSLVYGELSRDELSRYFAAVSPFLMPGAQFMDLGSGLGKVVMSAALQFPFSQCRGVEILPYRHRLATERFASLLKVGQEGMTQMAASGAQFSASDEVPTAQGSQLKLLHLLTLPARVELQEGDMFACDVSCASLVFIYSTCFGSFMHKIAHKLANELPEHALVSTTTYALKHPAFELVVRHPAKTLAWTDVFIYRKVGNAPWPELAEELLQPVLAPDPQAWEAQAREKLLSPK
jgi:hypothetical protein